MFNKLTMICKATIFCSYYKNGECFGIDCDCIAIGTDTEDYLRECYGNYDLYQDPYGWL